MDWKQSLDKWLTSEPEDLFSAWAEQVVDAVIDEVYTDNEAWFESEECDDMLNVLYKQDMDVIDASQEIEVFLRYNS